MRLPWECRNQSQDTNWRHWVTGPELPFFHKRKGVLKIDQSVKMPWHRLRMGVASSCSSAPGENCHGYQEWLGFFEIQNERRSLPLGSYQPVLDDSVNLKRTDDLGWKHLILFVVFVTREGMLIPMARLLVRCWAVNWVPVLCRRPGSMVLSIKTGLINI